MTYREGDRVAYMGHGGALIPALVIGTEAAEVVELMTAEHVPPVLTHVDYVASMENLGVCLESLWGAIWDRLRAGLAA